jgi:hypothetical protein
MEILNLTREKWPVIDQTRTEAITVECTCLGQGMRYIEIKF